MEKMLLQIDELVMKKKHSESPLNDDQKMQCKMNPKKEKLGVMKIKKK